MPAYLFKNISWHDGQKLLTGDIRTDLNVITEIGINLLPKHGEQTVELEKSFVYPGFINSHDHLEMNLYPKLGKPAYKNYLDWSKDIYKPNELPIREIESVNIDDRLLWGGVKNLISGSTTVVHHNPWNKFFEKDVFPVTVLKDIAWAHSLGFEKEPSKRFPRHSNIPFVIHAGEGVDTISASEIPRLHSLRMLEKNTVLIHAVAVDNESINTIANQKSAVVWCPSSNLFMLNVTTPVDKLMDKIRVALGTDSTLTGSPTLLYEMQEAVKTGLVSIEDVFTMVTKTASSIFNLTKTFISQATDADFFVAPIKHQDYFENLKFIGPEDISIILVRGKLRLLSSEVNLNAEGLKYCFRIKGQTKNITIDLASLKRRIEKKVGLRILEQNPLWTLLEV